ncbi:hypothetical protein QFC22_002170 [Naganishia vaughanmartiniae]|uniref:Uncharacterized protein n=1 Tax=Naganishia vaughanmartiniae TaxID=1424756 RepID=A0ACC2XD46_9TREE|nr:hypothetical protein QFC22_002170 [Naganishia vaughanmartiniae]
MISISGSAKGTEDMLHARQQKQAVAQQSTKLHNFKNTCRKTFGMTPLEAEPTAGPVIEIPPWELLQLNTACLDLNPIPTPEVLPLDEKRAALSYWPSREVSYDTSRTDDLSRNDRIHTSSTLVSSINGRNDSHDSQPKPTSLIDEKSENFIDVPDLLINDERVPSSLSGHEQPPSPLQLDQDLCPAPLPICELHSGISITNKSTVTFDIVEDLPQDAAGPETAGQTLKDFFQSHLATETEVRHAHGGGNIGPEESAAEYSNRQAALLMLYFPLAYIVIFSFSLVRLIHDMITSTPSRALTILSLWFVLSAGLIDAMVYGVAEIVIRRRVRRNLPDRD